MAKCYVLYGVAKRDRQEVVCQFFNKKSDMTDFVNDLPGTYRVIKIRRGIDYRKLDLKPMGKP